MKTRILLLALMIATCSATVCHAGDTLSIRLVSASSTRKGGVEGELDDVAPMLKRTLSYNTYRLVEKGIVALPADGSSVKLGELSVRCLGKKLRLHIAVDSGKKELLKTDVNLKAGKPFVVGAIPSGKQKFLLVFLVSD